MSDKWRAAATPVLLQRVAVPSLEVLFFAGHRDHLSGSDGMKTGQSLSLRETVPIYRGATRRCR